MARAKLIIIPLGAMWMHELADPGCVAARIQPRIHGKSHADNQSPCGTPRRTPKGQPRSGRAAPAASASVHQAER
eukprot:12797733-Alexandrium_andersonii.AAC.1